MTTEADTGPILLIQMATRLMEVGVGTGKVQWGVFGVSRTSGTRKENRCCLEEDWMAIRIPEVSDVFGSCFNLFFSGFCLIVNFIFFFIQLFSLIFHDVFYDVFV